jgi:hypothetical protein
MVFMGPYGPKTQRKKLRGNDRAFPFPQRSVWNRGRKRPATVSINELPRCFAAPPVETQSGRKIFYEGKGQAALAASFSNFYADKTSSIPLFLHII